MSFVYPLGLLGLLGIPAIVTVYILRSKYNEQTVSSTYIWELSERFLKRKNPLSGITGIIGLVLQILTIAAVSLAIAHPIFTVPGAAEDYYFILDTSGSMNMKDGDGTRFGSAKDKIERMIEDSVEGSTYTLDCVSSELVTVFEGVSDKDDAIAALDRIDSDAVSFDADTALFAAQKYFDKNTSALVYLVTDKEYTSHNGIELIKVGSSDECNFVLKDVSYTQSAGLLAVSAKVISYGSDAQLRVGLYVDDSAEPVAIADIYAAAEKSTDVILEYSTPVFSSFRVQIENEDALDYDNASVIYNTESEKTYSTLIISESGFFFEAVIDALTDSRTTVVTPDEYADITESYGLYIFDSYTPEELPDAAVWLVNSDRSVENSGFGVRGRVGLEQSAPIEKSESTASRVRTLLNGVDGDSIYIKNYVKYSSMYLSFATLFSYESSPLIFAGTNGLGNRQVVFGFDIHESDIALTPDFVILMRNLIDYSFPAVIEDAYYTVGDEVTVNIVANAENVKALSPSGEEIFAESDGASAIFTAKEVGTYTVSMDISGVKSTYRIYAAAHPDESVPATDGDSFSLIGERTEGGKDGRYDPLSLVFIILALLFLADWGVYCYEKYQLR